MQKSRVFFMLVLFLAAGLIFCYFKVPAVQVKIASIVEEEFTEENIYSDLETLSKRLDEEILKGSDSFIVYLEHMDINEINSINESLNGIYGTGESYQQIGTVGKDYIKVSITIKKSTNFYAMDAYLRGTPIPESEEKATALYNVIREIMTTQITESMTDYEKELALHDYLVTHCIYSSNPKQDATSDIYRAYGALVNQEAVCNGYAEAMAVLLQCAQIPTLFVVGTADGVDHAWNLVQLDEKWYHLDATWDDPLPDQGKDTLHPYFNVSDEIMAVSHEWNQEDYPKAFSMSDNYYKKNDAYFLSFDQYKLQAYQRMIDQGVNRYEAVIENYVENKDDMQFIFQNNTYYNRVNWQTFTAGSYCVVVLEAQ